MVGNGEDQATAIDVALQCEHCEGEERKAMALALLSSTSSMEADME